MAAAVSSLFTVQPYQRTSIDGYIYSRRALERIQFRTFDKRHRHLYYRSLDKSTICPIPYRFSPRDLAILVVTLAIAIYEDVY